MSSRSLCDHTAASSTEAPVALDHVTLQQQVAELSATVAQQKIIIDDQGKEILMLAQRLHEAVATIEQLSSASGPLVSVASVPNTEQGQLPQICLDLESNSDVDCSDNALVAADHAMDCQKQNSSDSLLMLRSGLTLCSFSVTDEHGVVSQADQPAQATTICASLLSLSSSDGSAEPLLVPISEPPGKCELEHVDKSQVRGTFPYHAPHLY